MVTLVCRYRATQQLFNRIEITCQHGAISRNPISSNVVQRSGSWANKVFARPASRCTVGFLVFYRAPDSNRSAVWSQPLCFVGIHQSCIPSIRGQAVKAKKYYPNGQYEPRSMLVDTARRLYMKDNSKSERVSVICGCVGIGAVTTLLPSYHHR